MIHESVDSVLAENRKLRMALNGLICWLGVSPDGPSWASPAAKAANRRMFNNAMRAAVECFPEFSCCAGDEAEVLIDRDAAN